MWLAKLVGLRYMTQVSDSQNPSPHCTAQSVVIFVWWLAPCLPGDDVTCHVSRVPTCDHCNMCPPCGRRPVMAVMDSPTSKFYTNGHQGHSSSTATSTATNTDPLQLLNIFYTKNPYLGEENEQHQNGTIIHIYLVFKKYGKFLGLIDNQRSQYLWHQNTATYCPKPTNTPCEQMSNLRIPQPQFYCGWHRSQPLQPHRGPEVGGQWGQYWRGHRGPVVTLYCRRQTSGVHLACKLTILAKWCLWSAFHCIWIIASNEGSLRFSNHGEELYWW